MGGRDGTHAHLHERHAHQLGGCVPVRASAGRPSLRGTDKHRLVPGLCGLGSDVVDKCPLSHYCLDIRVSDGVKFTTVYVRVLEGLRVSQQWKWKNVLSYQHIIIKCVTNQIHIRDCIFFLVYTKIF